MDPINGRMISILMVVLMVWFLKTNKPYVELKYSIGKLQNLLMWVHVGYCNIKVVEVYV